MEIDIKITFTDLGDNIFIFESVDDASIVGLWWEKQGKEISQVGNMLFVN